jgi:hypothetical protein
MASAYSYLTVAPGAKLPIKALPYAAQQAHLFLALSSGALLSIDQLCDQGCQAIFNLSTVNII